MIARNIRTTAMLALLLALCVLHLATPAQSQTGTGIRLIIRGDDIASSHAANVACIKTATEGIAQSLEIMAPCPWFPEAAAMLNQHPGIDVGVHITLTSEWDNIKWGPLTDAPSLSDSRGYFYPTTRQVLSAGPKSAEVERELRAQIELALASLPNVTHMTGHMGIADLTPEIRAIVDRLATEYKLPYEVPGTRSFGGFSGNTIEEKTLSMIEKLEALEPGLWLFVEHPGLDTPEMRAIGHQGNDDVAEARNAVTAVWTDPRVKAAIERRGIELVSYGELLREPGTGGAPAGTPRY